MSILLLCGWYGCNIPDGLIQTAIFALVASAAGIAYLLAATIYETVKRRGRR